MADNLRNPSTSYAAGRDDDRADYSRSSFPEGHATYEAYGSDRDRAREFGDQPYPQTYRYERDTGWSNVADTGNLAVLAIGAGLGFLAGYMASGSGRRSASGWQGQSGRRWSSANANNSRSVERDETSELIASNKVEGTAVYDRQGNKLGEVYNFMVGKRSGRVAYAVMSFGGLLGIGGSHYPLPWRALDYDTEKGGYVVDLDKDRLNDAPSHGAGENGFADPNYGRRVSEYWLVAR